MITYSKNLYLTDKTGRDLRKIKRRLKSGAGLMNVKLITLASNGKDVFDILPAFMFKLKNFRKYDHHVIGIAENKKAAFRLIERMTGEYLNDRENISPGMSMREYFVRSDGSDA